MRTSPVSRTTRRIGAVVGGAVGLALALNGCSAARISTSAPDTPAASSPPTTTTHTAARAATGPTKVLVVIEENHSYRQMKSGMPFLASLSDRYGYATHWTALAHPSEPNYLAIVGGSTFGILDDRSPAAHTSDIGSATTVFDQALAAGKTAATYAETMPKNCHVYDYPDRKVGTPKYAVRHNPWVYFPKSRTNCLAHDVALTAFAGNASRNGLPNVGFLIPNLDHDAHDGSLATADAWLKRRLSPVLSSTDFTRGKLVVVVTADEDDRSSGNTVLTSVLTPRLSHKVVGTALTHYSLTRYLAQVLGVAPLKSGATAPDMKAAFGL